MINNTAEGHVRRCGSIVRMERGGEIECAVEKPSTAPTTLTPPIFSSLHSLVELLMVLVRYRGLG